MNDDSFSSPADMRAFLDSTFKTNLRLSAEQQYSWLAKMLKQTGYFKLRKKDRRQFKNTCLR